jgi:hypothetical protein
MSSPQTAYTSYVDEQGLPILRRSAVLFFDVLGTEAMARRVDAQARLRSFVPVLEEARGLADARDTTGLQALTWFTDNVVVGWPVTGLPAVDEEMAMGMATICASYLQLRLACEAHFARGAITFGDVHMGDRIAFGQALVDAVRLEKEVAVYPRVVLDAAAVSVERHSLTYYADKAQAPQNRSILIDADDVVFVDYLGLYLDEEDEEDTRDYWVARHRDAISSSLTDHAGDVRVETKLQWAASYHNAVISDRLPAPSAYLIPGALDLEFRRLV